MPSISATARIRSRRWSLADPPGLEPEAQVVENAEVRVKRGILEDHGDIAAVGGNAPDVAAAQQDACPSPAIRARRSAAGAWSCPSRKGRAPPVAGPRGPPCRAGRGPRRRGRSTGRPHGTRWTTRNAASTTGESPAHLPLSSCSRFSHNDYDVIQPVAVLPLQSPQPTEDRVSMDRVARQRAIGLILTVAGAGLLVPLRAGEPVSRPRPKPATAAGAEAPAEKFTADQKGHWSYQPLERPEPPGVRELPWVRNPIDRFILSELESIELPHAPEADRVALIRRVTYDLTGLPPSPLEVASFLADDRRDAYERLVDRLLEEPALWRAVGPALARPGPLRRLERIRARRRAARRLAVSRLGGACPQRRHALRPVRRASARRRRARAGRSRRP